MAQTKKIYKLNDVVEILGIPRTTYYSWEAAGKVPKAKRDPMSKYRIFTEEDVKKLRKITGY